MASDAAIGKAAGKAFDYLNTHTPEQAGADIAGAVSKAWSRLEADHARAAAQGPEAEARWLGQIVGRASFEIASFAVPVTKLGMVGKAAGVAAHTAEAAADVVKVADAVADGANVADVMGDAGRIARASDADRAVNKTLSFSSDIIQQAKLTRLSPNKIKEVFETTKGNRPNPEAYMSQSAIKAHIKPFEQGAVRIQPNIQTGTIGRTETWVFPKAFVDDAIKQAKGDPRKLETLLGLDSGYLGKNPIRVDIPAPKNLKIPNGNEFGANDFWRPGGYTYPGGIPEAIIDPVPAGSYSTGVTVTVHLTFAYMRKVRMKYANYRVL